MIAILVHWLIRPGCEQDFEQRWRAMTVDAHAGLYREILTTLEKPGSADQSSDDRFHTFSVGDPFYMTYINIGLWKDLESFDSAIGKYITNVKVEEKDGRRVHVVELEEFEFKLRERVVLKVIGSRGADLPPAASRQLGGQVLQYDKLTDKSGSWHDLFAWSSPTRFTI